MDGRLLNVKWLYMIPRRCFKFFALTLPADLLVRGRDALMYIAHAFGCMNYSVKYVVTRLSTLLRILASCS